MHIYQSSILNIYSERITMITFNRKKKHMFLLINFQVFLPRFIGCKLDKQSIYMIHVKHLYGDLLCLPFVSESINTMCLLVRVCLSLLSLQFFLALALWCYRSHYEIVVSDLVYEKTLIQ